MSVDLSTTYLKLTLRNPLIVSAGPLTSRLHLIPALEEAGAAAIVLPSLFEEQVEHSEWQAHLLDQYGAESFSEAITYFPALDDDRVGPSEYCKKIEESKKSVRIPVIASLNGTSPGGWVRHARAIADAGADAIELNIYHPSFDPLVTSSQIEQQHVELLAQVREQVSIPIAVKIGPYFTSVPHMARQLEEAGADGLVLFNRFLHPDINLEALEFTPQLELSQPAEARLSLRWIAVLREHLRLSLAANSGVRSVEDVVKAILVGADGVMLLAALLERGIDHLRLLRDGLQSWLEEHDYESVRQMKGSMCRAHCSNPESLERANYMRALDSYSGPIV